MGADLWSLKGPQHAHFFPLIIAPGGLQAVDWVLFLWVGCISGMVLMGKGRLRHMLPLTSCHCGTRDHSHSGWRNQIRKHVTPNLTIVWNSLTILIHLLSLAMFFSRHLKVGSPSPTKHPILKSPTPRLGLYLFWASSVFVDQAFKSRLLSGLSFFVREVKGLGRGEPLVP